MLIWRTNLFEHVSKEQSNWKIIGAKKVWDGREERLLEKGKLKVNWDTETLLMRKKVQIADKANKW